MAGIVRLAAELNVVVVGGGRSDFGVPGSSHWTARRSRCCWQRVGGGHRREGLALLSPYPQAAPPPDAAAFRPGVAARHQATTTICHISAPHHESCNSSSPSATSKDDGSIKLQLGPCVTRPAAPPLHQQTKNNGAVRRLAAAPSTNPTAALPQPLLLLLFAKYQETLKLYFPAPPAAPLPHQLQN